MDYRVCHESKFISVFGENAPEDELKNYASKGYKIAYFIRGNTPMVDIIRGVVLNRCTQE